MYIATRVWVHKCVWDLHDSVVSPFTIINIMQIFNLHTKKEPQKVSYKLGRAIIELYTCIYQHITSIASSPGPPPLLVTLILKRSGVIMS